MLKLKTWHNSSWEHELIRRICKAFHNFYDSHVNYYINVAP